MRKIKTNTALFLELTTLDILLSFPEIMSFIYKIISSELVAIFRVVDTWGEIEAEKES